MPRRRSRRNNRSKVRAQRGAPRTANRDPLTSLSRLLRSPMPVVHEILDQGKFGEVQDNRTWNPTENEPVTVTGSPAKVRPAGAPRRLSGLNFARSSEVLTCVRRKARREVMFATRRTGKGSRARRKRNATSNVSCRR